MTDYKEIETVYKQHLEEDIIEYIANTLHIDLREAMNKYYSSSLARQIEMGEYGIENLDYKNLAENLLEIELRT